MTIEDVERYWSARPCNIRHSPISVDEDPLAYSKAVTARKYFVEPHIPAFADFERWRGKYVLELGCGIGTDTLSFLRVGACVLGVDISSESLEIARKRLEAEQSVMTNMYPLGFLKHNIEDSAIPGPMMECVSKEVLPSTYNLVYSFGVIHHTPHPDAAVKNAYNYLSQGGEFRLMLYHRRSWKVLLILLRNWKQLLQGKSVDQVVAMESEAQSGCPVTWTFTKASAQTLLESCGFEVENMEIAHIFPYRVEDYVNYRYIKEWWWRWMPARLFHWLERRIGWHILITARKA